MFAMPGRRTAFRDVQSVRPGGYVRIDLSRPVGRSAVTEHVYWDLTFPDAGHESSRTADGPLVEKFTEVFRTAVRRRLRADVPVGAYLSGGVDSAWLVATASDLSESPISTWTARLPGRYDEESEAGELSRWSAA